MMFLSVSSSFAILCPICAQIYNHGDLYTSSISFGHNMNEDRKRNFTDAFITNAKALADKTGKVQTTEYHDTKINGLRLRVSATGGKSWSLRYRANGKHRRMSLGKIGIVSLADARNAARQVIADVSNDGDPVLEKQLAKASENENMELRTITQIGEWYFQECAVGRHRPNARGAKKQSTIQMEVNYFNRCIVPALGDFELDDLTRAHIQKFVNGLAKKVDPKTGNETGSNSAAIKCKVILHSLYNFAMRNDLVEKNPVQFVAVAPIPSRERVLTEKELQIVWNTFQPPVDIKGLGTSPTICYIILLCIVTLQRRGEVAGMTMDELDLENKLWTIPSSRTKNKRTHVVPLSDLATEIIEKALAIRTEESVYVFPSTKVGIDEAIDPHSATRAFARFRKAVGLENIHIHDLRRTGATMMTGEKLGVPRFIVSKILNHAGDSGGAAVTTGVYDRNEYLKEKRGALKAWNILMLSIV